MVPITEVFLVRYGNKLDANKQTFSDDGINFVSRTSKNLGVIGRVESVSGQVANQAGLITVTMGGGYLLSAFVQPAPFYTAQNVKVLTPLEPMSLAERAYYCRCITANRRRYSNHGREANRSFDQLIVPSRDEVPDWVHSVAGPTLVLKPDHITTHPGLSPPANPELVRLDKIFDVRSGINLGADHRYASKDGEDFVPYVRPSKTQAGSYVEWADISEVPSDSVYPRHALYVSTNGQGSHTYAYVSTDSFVPNTDVSVLLEKRNMGLQEKLYYAAVITANRPLFSYGRKPKGERLKRLMIPEWAPAFVYDTKLAEVLVA